ncbi:MAG: hypothetical protein FWD74_07770 [Actinomycetia bacterium]|nr:hypothetical protein [Actinomycetes bacterium]
MLLLTGCAIRTDGAGELLEPATQGVTEAEQLLTQIATAVSPGAKLSKYDDQGRYIAEAQGWDACTPPSNGKVYRTVISEPGHLSVDAAAVGLNSSAGGSHDSGI